MLVGDVGERRAEAADVALDELDAAARLDLVASDGPQLLERRRQHRPDVGDRQRDGVLVAVKIGGATSRTAARNRP